MKTKKILAGLLALMIAMGNSAGLPIALQITTNVISSAEDTSCQIYPDVEYVAMQGTDIFRGFHYNLKLDSNNRFCINFFPTNGAGITWYFDIASKEGNTYYLNNGETRGGIAHSVEETNNTALITLNNDGSLDVNINGKHSTNLHMLSIEEFMKNKLKETVDGDISIWQYDDYDGDNTKETAFAVVSERSTDKKIKGVYCIDRVGDVKLIRSSVSGAAYSGAENSYVFEHEGKKFFHFDYGAGGSSWKTIACSVKNSEAYELQLSKENKLQTFDKDEIGVYTLESYFKPEGGHGWNTIDLIYEPNKQDFKWGTKREDTPTSEPNLEISSEYENNKLGEIQINSDGQYPVKDFSVDIKNTGTQTAKNTYAKIILPKGMKLVKEDTFGYNDSDTISIGDLDGSENHTCSWGIQVDSTIKTGLHSIKVIYGADGVEEKIETYTIDIKGGKDAVFAYVTGDFTSVYNPKTNEYSDVELKLDLKNSKDNNFNIKNLYIKIELPNGMSLISGKESEIIDLFRIKTGISRSWKIKISAEDVWGGMTYPIKITYGGDNLHEETIVKEITFSNKEEIKDNTIEWGKDNLNFINSDDNPLLNWNHPGFTGCTKYDISDPYFNMLTDGMSNTVVETLKEKKEPKDGWGGSCRGMSTVVSLMKAGYLTPSYWQKEAKTTHDLKNPTENSKVMDLINFYQLQQYLPDAQKERQDYERLYKYTGDTHADDSRFLKQLVDETKKVKSGGLPVRIGFSWETINKYHEVKVPGHSVIAYDVVECADNEKINGNYYKYKISICDPNQTHCTYLYVSEDYKKWDYPDEFKLNANADKDGYKLVKDSWYITGVTSDLALMDLKNPEKDIDRTVLKNYQWSFIIDKRNSVSTISSSSGKTATVNGINSEGNLKVGISPDCGITADGQSSGRATIFLPDEEKGAYTITPKDDKLDVSLTFENNMFSVDADDVNSAKYDPAGTVSVDLENSPWSVDATFNEGHGDLPWFTVTAESKEKANNISLSIADKGMILKGDNLKNVKVIANNRNEEVKVTPFSTDKDSVLIDESEAGVLGVYEDKDGNGTYETLISDSKKENPDPKPKPNPKPTPNNMPLENPKTGKAVKGLSIGALLIGAVAVFKKRNKK